MADLEKEFICFCSSAVQVRIFLPAARGVSTDGRAHGACGSRSLWVPADLSPRSGPAAWTSAAFLDDDTASPASRRLASAHAPPERGHLYFHHGLLGRSARSGPGACPRIRMGGARCGADGGFGGGFDSWEKSFENDLIKNIIPFPEGLERSIRWYTLPLHSTYTSGSEAL